MRFLFSLGPDSFIWEKGGNDGTCQKWSCWGSEIMWGKHTPCSINGCYDFVELSPNPCSETSALYLCHWGPALASTWHLHQWLITSTNKTDSLRVVWLFVTSSRVVGHVRWWSSIPHRTAMLSSNCALITSKDPGSLISQKTIFHYLVQRLN